MRICVAVADVVYVGKSQVESSVLSEWGYVMNIIYSLCLRMIEFEQCTNLIWFQIKK